MADVGGLHDFVRGLGDGQLHLRRVAQDVLRQLLYLGGHGGGEHHGLPLLGQALHDLHDVVIEAHVQHAVRLVQHEERHAGQVHVSQAEVGDEASRRGDDHVRAQRQALLLLLEEDAVVAAVDGHARHGQEVGESLHLLVNLLGQLAGGGHDDAVDGVLGVSAFGQFVEDGQHVGGGLAGARLCHGYQVAALEDDGDGLLLYGGALFEAHGVQCVQHLVVQVQFGKLHRCISDFVCKSKKNIASFPCPEAEK